MGNTDYNQEVETVLADLKERPRHYLYLSDLNDLNYSHRVTLSWIMVFPQQRVIDLANRLDREGVRLSYFAGGERFNWEDPESDLNRVQAVSTQNSNIDPEKISDPPLKKFLSALMDAATRLRSEYILSGRFVSIPLLDCPVFDGGPISRMIKIEFAPV